MSFRPLLTRAGAAAAAGGAVLNQSAQARSAPIPQQQQQHQLFADAKNSFEEDWTLPQFDLGSGDVVFLRPEEITQAADEFRHATYGMRSFDDETSSNDSDEHRATEVIELSESMHHSTATRQPAYFNGEGVNLLLDLATEMLKRPSVQQEVMSIIADNPHLHRALLAPPPPASPARLTAPQQLLLLEAPSSPRVEEEADEDEDEAAKEPAASGQHSDAWHALLTNLQQTLAAMGSQLGGLRMRLAHWLRVVLLGQRADTVQPDQPAAAAAAAGLLPNGAADGSTIHPFLKAAMAVAVVVACVAIAKRPGWAAAIIAMAAKRTTASR